TFEAFENAMAMGIARGGSTNPIPHLLAPAQEAQVDFTMADTDRLSRKVPQPCKVAPTPAHCPNQTVHRAGAVLWVLGELDRAGLLHVDLPTVHSATLRDALYTWDLARAPSDAVSHFYKAGPAGIPTQVAFSQDTRWPSLDTDRENGCIRAIEHAYSQ